MKMRNKGKVHPFTTIATSSSSSSNSNVSDSYSVLNLLPAAILTLISILSLEEREVLAYMITRSLKSTSPPFIPAEDKKKSSKKQCFDSHGHKSPALFDCDCFHCYTSFWFRWDSSPNRELIHHAIEAFEEHLNKGEQFKNGKTKKKDKLGRRKTEKSSGEASGGAVLDFPAPENKESVGEIEAVTEEAEEAVEAGAQVEEAAEEETAAPSMVVRTHKGLARKVLPDVMGIFSSRLWSLWSPNV